MGSSAPRPARRRSSPHVLWPLLAVGALLAAIIVWRAPGAGADSSIAESGQVGTNFLFDEPANPGARCLYSPGTGTFSITVDGPYVLGLDRSPGTEQTEVSWRAIAVRNGVQVQTSASLAGTAFEGQSAGFTTPIELALLDTSGTYTAQVEITWFESTAAGPPIVLGTSLRGVDVYAQNLEGTGGPDAIVNSCQAFPDPTPEPTATTPPLPTATLAPTATIPPEPTAAPSPTPTVPAAPTATATTAPAAPTSTPAPPATATPPASPSGPPRLTMNSARGTVNAKVRLEIAGFPANSYVEVTFAGATVAGLTTTPGGTASVKMTVPAKPKGHYEVRAAASAASAVTAYEVVPRVKVIPGSAGPGDQVEISLRGFAKNERVRVRWSVDGRWVELIVIERTSNTGSANVFVTVPATTAPGPAKVRGDGAIARAQTNAFVVTD